MRITLGNVYLLSHIMRELLMLKTYIIYVQNLFLAIAPTQLYLLRCLQIKYLIFIYINKCTISFL